MSLRRGAIAALALVLAGCSRPADPPTSEPAVAKPIEVRLALLPPSREGDAAATVGTLAVDGPCLYLKHDDGSRTLPAFMTFDTRWQDGAVIVGDRRFRPGQRVTLGGSEVNGAVANMAWVQAPDPGCDTARIWVTVSIGPA